MNKYWLWFRLLIANQPCMCLFGLFVAASFAIPIAWLFTFVAVCRAAAAAGASGYLAQLGVLAAYSIACAAASICMFGCGSGLIWTANVPGNGCDGDPYNDDARQRRRAAWLAALSATDESDDLVTSSEHDAHVAQHPESATGICYPLGLVDKLKWAYLLLAIAAFVPTFLGIMPLLLVRASSYGSAFGDGCVLIGLYIAAAGAVYCLPFIAYGIIVAVRGLYNYIIGTYANAAAVADKFAPV